MGQQELAQEWFLSEVLKPRYRWCMVGCAAAYFVLFMISGALCRLCIWPPMAAIEDVLSTLISLKQNLLLVLGAGVYAITMIPVLQIFKVGNEPSGPRIVQLVRLLTSKSSLVFITTYTGIHLILLRIWLWLADSSLSSLLKRRNSDEFMVVDPRNAFAGFCAFTFIIRMLFDFYNRRSCRVKFDQMLPRSPSDVKLWLQKKLVPHCLEMSQNVLVHVIILLPIFALIGDHLIIPPLATICGANIGFTSKLTFIMDLCSLRMLMATVAFLFLISFNNWISLIIINYYLTMPYSFPLMSLMGDVINPKILYLHIAMGASSNTLLKYHAVRWLLEISKKKDIVISQVFALSIPGGHPRNWSSIFAESMSCLRELSERIEKRNRQSTIRPISGTGTVTATSATMSNGKPNVNMPPHMKALQHGNKPGYYTSPMEYLVRVIKDITPDRVALCFTQLIRRASKTRLINYLISDPADSEASALFYHIDLYVWTIEALGNFAATAFHGDKFGVVQKDLSMLLGTLLDILAALDRYARLTGRSLRGSSYEDPDTLLIRRLYDVLTGALRHISETYGTSLNSVRLSAEQSGTLHGIRSENSVFLPYA